MEDRELGLLTPTDTRSASAETAIAWTDLLREWFVSVDILPAERVRGRRLDRCRQALIARPTATISEIISRFGFADLAAFSRAFTARYGMSPTAFRAVGA